MNIEDLIKKYESLEGVWSANGAEIARHCFLRDLKQLNAIDTKKVTVPQYVADWYEDIVDEFYVVLERLVLNYKNNTDMPICKWFFETEDALTILINMHQFGYEIEKEKRYEVILCNGQSLKTVYRQGEDRLDFEKVYGDIERFTRKQLEEAGFGWVFDCEGMEVEEV